MTTCLPAKAGLPAGRQVTDTLTVLHKLFMSIAMKLNQYPVIPYRLSKDGFKRVVIDLVRRKKISESKQSEQNNFMTQTEAFRRQMPPPLGLRPLNLPEPFETTLANGLQVVIVEDRRLPLVSFRLAFRSGDANDPAPLPGTSDMMSHLLTEGTETRTSRQLAEEVERIGATLNVGSGSDFTTVAGSALSIYSEEILELMADVTQRSSFPRSRTICYVEYLL